MVGSIQLHLARVAPMMLLVIGVPTRPDPINKRAVGNAGIIPIPAAATTAPATNAHGDLMVPEGRRDTRADRGRVLYADGHASRDSVAVRTLHKHPCPDQRVVQGRNGTSSPNS